jgi:hypothetical protein
MFIYYITIYLAFIKLLSNYFLSFLLFNSIALKLIGIVALLGVIKLLEKFPRTRFKKLSELREFRKNKVHRYALRSSSEHVWNLIIIFAYLSIFVIGMLWLRFLSLNASIDLVKVFTTIISTLESLPYLEAEINLVFLLIFFRCYIKIFSKSFLYYKFHLMKRHLWLAKNEWIAKPEWYTSGLVKFSLFLYDFHLPLFVTSILSSVFSYLSKNNILTKKRADRMWFTLSHSFRFLYNHIHYFILIGVILYDLFFNDLVLTRMFKVLPWVTLYDMYLKFCTFIHKFHSPSDALLSKFIYTKLTYINNKYAMLGDELIEISELSDPVNLYLAFDFDNMAVMKYHKMECKKMKEELKAEYRRPPDDIC